MGGAAETHASVSPPFRPEASWSLQKLAPKPGWFGCCAEPSHGSMHGQPAAPVLLLANEGAAHARRASPAIADASRESVSSAVSARFHFSEFF